MHATNGVRRHRHQQTSHRHHHDALEDGARHPLETTEKSLHAVANSMVTCIWSRPCRQQSNRSFPDQDMSGMNVSDKMVPRTAHFHELPGCNIDFRVSTIPPPTAKRRPSRIRQEKMMIGCRNRHQRHHDWLELARLTTGLIGLRCHRLGKTTTLYSTVRHLNLLELQSTL